MTYELLLRADAFASGAHRAVNQTRKYSGLPYIVHPREVRDIAHNSTYVTAEGLAAALLHDVVEDTEVTLGDIEEEFGGRVADLVEMLTDVSKPEDGNRATRKAIDRAHSAEADQEGQTIKVCDLIANTLDITEADPDFAVVYMKEKVLLLRVLTKADPILRNRAWELIDDYYKSVGKELPDRV